MSNQKIHNILISQPPPSDENSPYFRLADKWELKVDFRKFIQIEGISLNDFRKLSLNPLDFGSIVFTSKVAIDHFFGLLEELRIEMPPDTKYFCVSEATSKYLQKYIVIRKRKLFVGERMAMDLQPYITKHKGEKYLFPCSEGHRSSLLTWMRDQNINVQEAAIYGTVASDLSDVEVSKYDMICFFSPSGVKSLFKNFPSFEQGDMRVAVFGPRTNKEADASGLRVDIQAPQPGKPSMTAAIDGYIKEIGEQALG